MNLGVFVASSVVALAAVASGAGAQDVGRITGGRVASVTFGPYIRAELGAARVSPENGYWLSPGQSDPKVTFDLDGDTAGYGALAFGYDWQNGIRADVALIGDGRASTMGPCASVSDASSCSLHADITDASVSTTALMVNLFYAPTEARGSHSVFSPFVVAGVGIASNSVSNWTRENTDGSDRDFRTFEGAKTSSAAWSIGIGAAWQVTRPGRRPVIVEVGWRYFDFGKAEGGATPLPGNGQSEPRQPLTFGVTDQIISLGVRIPLQRL